MGLPGWVGLALTSQAWLAFVINLTILGFSGATGALVFAAVRDQLTNAPTGADNRVMSTVRLGFSLGFLTGPLLGSVLGGWFGLRATLVVGGLCTLLQAAPMIGQRVTRSRRPEAESTEASTGAAVGGPPAGTRGLRPLVVFLGLCVFAMCGDTIRFAYLPIFMELRDARRDRRHRGAGSVPAGIRDGVVVVLLGDPVLGRGGRRGRRTRSGVIRRPRCLRRGRDAVSGVGRRAARPSQVAVATRPTTVPHNAPSVRSDTLA